MCFGIGDWDIFQKKKRMERLIKDNILPNLDLSKPNDCINCFKGKLTNKRKFGSIRSQKLLEIIHSDVCGPFPNSTICKNVYFVTFIDDFSRYGYVYLISEKLMVFNYFKFSKMRLRNN